MKRRDRTAGKPLKKIRVTDQSTSDEHHERIGDSYPTTPEPGCSTKIKKREPNPRKRLTKRKKNIHDVVDTRDMLEFVFQGKFDPLSSSTESEDLTEMKRKEPWTWKLFKMMGLTDHQTFDEDDERISDSNPTTPEPECSTKDNVPEPACSKETKSFQHSSDGDDEKSRDSTLDGERPTKKKVKKKSIERMREKIPDDYCFLCGCKLGKGPCLECISQGVEDAVDWAYERKPKDDSLNGF